MNITEQNTIEDLERVLKGQQVALEEYKKREAQQLNAVKEAIQKLSPPNFVPTDEQRAICVGCKSKLPSWIVVDALEINAIKIDPDRKYHY